MKNKSNIGRHSFKFRSNYLKNIENINYNVNKTNKYNFWGNNKIKERNIAILSLKELNIIKNNSILSKKEDIKSNQNLDKDKNLQNALAHKNKLLAIDKVKNNIEKNNIILSSDNKKYNDKMVKKASNIKYENLDEVKKMNQIVNYAKCAYIRDKQIEEKKLINKKKIDELKKLDLMMEIERIKNIKKLEHKDELRRKREIEARKLIIDQIKENNYKRIKEKEYLEKEVRYIKREMDKLDIEEKNKLVEKNKIKNWALKEILKNNSQIIEIKKLKEQREIEEDNQIKNYLIEKQRKEDIYHEEQLRIKLEKDSQVAKIREKQERALDKQSELDTLRAKRALEKKERIIREKEQKLQQEKYQKNLDLQKIRKKQQEEKQWVNKLRQHEERENFLKIIEKDKELINIDKIKEKNKKTSLKNYSNQLQKQILINNEKKIEMNKYKVEEHKKLLDDDNLRSKIIQLKKNDKINYLRDLSIPDKYQVDLIKNKF